MPKLIVSMPDGTEVTHELSEDQITVGRISDNMIQIEDASVSSHHAQLTVTGGDYHLKDLNSTNGTRVNGKSIEEAHLRNGDQVRFGKVETLYASEIASEAQPMPEEASHAVMPSESPGRAPAGFANASPFTTKNKKKDSVGMGVMAFAILAIVVFCAALAKIMMLQPPQ